MPSPRLVLSTLFRWNLKLAFWAIPLNLAVLGLHEAEKTQTFHQVAASVCQRTPELCSFGQGGYRLLTGSNRLLNTVLLKEVNLVVGVIDWGGRALSSPSAPLDVASRAGSSAPKP